MTDQLPFTSREVRWFFQGSLEKNAGLEHWFQEAEPFAKRGAVPSPVLESRLDDAPDEYLLLPDHADMGIKWREGLLQIKGRVASVGPTTFCGRHAGIVERWVKWSYGDLPEQYRALFEPRQRLRTASVSKTRAVRLIDLQNGVADAEEVDVKTWLDCGIAAEITDLEIDGNRYCTLGFEAFPDAEVTAGAFNDAVAAFLETFGEPALQVEQSMSYPPWLNSLL